MKDEVPWQACIICTRKWKESSLEFEMCPECFHEIRKCGYTSDYDAIKISQRLKYADPKELNDTVRMMWDFIYRHME